MNTNLGPYKRLCRSHLLLEEVCIRMNLGRHHQTESCLEINSRLHQKASGPSDRPHTRKAEKSSPGCFAERWDSRVRSFPHRSTWLWTCGRWSRKCSSPIKHDTDPTCYEIFAHCTPKSQSLAVSVALNWLVARSILCLEIIYAVNRRWVWTKYVAESWLMRTISSFDSSEQLRLWLMNAARDITY